MKQTCVFLLVCLQAAFAAAQDKPAWVDNPSSAYPETLYIAASGTGRDRTSAENNAKAALAASFKQSVSSRITLHDSEQQQNGRTTSSSSLSQSVEASAALDSLIGVDIKSVWNDKRDKLWWACAVMEKEKGRERYAGELDKALREINLLVDTRGGVSFETITNCLKAKELFPAAETHALVLRMLDGQDRLPEISRLALKTDDTLKQARAMPVDVRVTGDVNGRFRAAFGKAFTDLGFRTGNRNSRFALEVTVYFEPLTQSKYFNTRYTVDAVLRDTGSGAELCAYNIADRESHPGSQRESNDRALLAAEQTVKEEFAKVLLVYLGFVP